MDAPSPTAQRQAVDPPDLVLDRARLLTLASTQLLDSAPEEVFDRISRMAARLLRAPVAVLSLVDANRQFFKSAVGLSEPWASQRETPLSYSFCQHVVRAGAPLVVEDARLHPLVAHSLAVTELDVTAYLGVPLKTPEQQTLGALCVVDGQVRRWSDEDLAVMDELAAAAAREIELRRALRESERQAKILAAVLEHMSDGVAIATTDGVPLVLNRAARSMLLDGPPATPSRLSQEFGLYLPDGVTPCPEDRVPLVRALAGEQVYDQEIFICGGSQQDQPRWHSVNASPIRDGEGRIIAAVAVGRDVTDRKRAEAVRAAQAEELRALSMHDELTGLFNRRGFVTQAIRALAAAHAAGRSACVLFVDVNGMKGVNDGLGHQVGDRLLSDTAQVLHEVFRSTDLVARLGGDEFVVMATDVPAEGAAALMGRLDVAVRRHNERSGRPYTVSLSVGEAISAPGSTMSVEALIEQADRAMYAQKRAARGG